MNLKKSQRAQKMDPDWISCALKPLTKKIWAGMHKNKNYTGKNQQNAFFGPVETLLSR